MKISAFRLNNFGNVRVFERCYEVKRILHSIRNDNRGGRAFRSNLKRLAFILGSNLVREWKSIVSINNLPVIVDISRGGEPLGEGLKVLFPASFHCHAYYDSRVKPEMFLLPANFPKAEPQNVIIADTVLATGRTIEKAIRAIRKVVRVKRIFVITGVASLIGIRALARKYPHVLIYAGCVETKYKWLKKDGKLILQVHGIVGDIGELVSVERENPGIYSLILDMCKALKPNFNAGSISSKKESPIIR